MDAADRIITENFGHGDDVQFSESGVLNCALRDVHHKADQDSLKLDPTAIMGLPKAPSV